MNAPLAIDQPRAVKLTVADYRLLDGAGAFSGYQGTELIDGTVFAVSPLHRPHGFIRDELAYRLRRTLEDARSILSVATEQSVDMAPLSEPLPDIIVTDARRGLGPIPVAAVALLVEVSASTLAFDLGEKARTYAEAGVPEYWVADVDGRAIHQLWKAVAGAYAERRTLAFGDRLSAVTIPGLAVATDGLI